MSVAVNADLKEREKFEVQIIILMKNEDGSFSDLDVSKDNMSNGSPHYQHSSKVNPSAFQEYLRIVLQDEGIGPQVDEEGNFING